MTASAAPRTDAETPQLRLLSSVPALDGFRGIAVLIVVAFHSSLLLTWWHHRFIEAGGLGVDAFFVLSGFLITALLLREQANGGGVRVGAFYRRRALRLLPALIVFLSAHAIYATIAHLPAAPERSSLGSALFYYLNTGLRRGALSEGIGHLWSLSVEEQFYLVWPLLVLLVVGLSRRTTTVVFVMIGAIIAVDVHRAVRYQQGAAVLPLHIGAITRADSLLVGALLAQLWVRGKTPAKGLALAAWAALGFYAYLVMESASERFFYLGGYTAVAIAVAVMILALLESDWSAARFLRLRPLRMVGRVSYGLYIWHLAVFAAVVRYGAGWAPVTRLVVGLGLSAIACWASWTFVEQPFLRWKSRLEKRKRPRRAVRWARDPDSRRGRAGTRHRSITGSRAGDRDRARMSPIGADRSARRRRRVCVHALGVMGPGRCRTAGRLRSTTVLGGAQLRRESRVTVCGCGMRPAGARPWGWR